MQSAGFLAIDTGLESAPVLLENAATCDEFVATIILRHQMELMADDEMRKQSLGEFAERAAQSDPPYELDYWRLNLQARKPV